MDLRLKFKNLLIGLSLGYLTSLGNKYRIVIGLAHFEISEFRNEWPFLSNKLFKNLDKFRDLIKISVNISPAKGSMIRFKENYEGLGVPSSQHFYGRAIDVIISRESMIKAGLNIDNVIDIAKKAGFTGIGLYPDSAGNQDRIRLHLDVRKPTTKNHIAKWGNHNGLAMTIEKAKIYV